MRRLAYLIVSVLIATTPVLAADTPAAESGASQVEPDSASATRKKNKKTKVTKPRVSDPFSDEQTTDPFGGHPIGGDPFSATSSPAAAEEDPFAAPVTPATSPKRAAAPSAVKKQRRTTGQSVKSIPSVTLGDASEARQRIETQLNNPTKFDYLDTPLKDVIDEIALRHDIPILINARALEDFGIGTDTPVTIGINGVTLRSALRLMLHELDLTYIIRDEVMRITTPEEAEANLQSRFYSVSRLLPADGDGEYLVKLIAKHIARDSWDEVGGPGAITYVPHLETLTVTQTHDVLREVDALLASMATMSDQQRKNAQPPSP